MAAPASSTPRVRVAAVVQVEGSIVLVRHRKGEESYHLLPGGGVDFGETLERALVREVREETGLDIALSQLLFVNDTIDPSGDRHVVNLTFSARVTGGALTDRPEDPRVEAVELIKPARLMELDLRPPLTDALQRWLQGGVVRGEYLGPLFTPGDR